MVVDSAPDDIPDDSFSDFSSILSRGEHTHLRELSIPELQASTLSGAEESHQLKRAPLSAHNDAALIHRLPTELLSSIFIWCYQDTQRIRIAHVCRRWRDVLLNTSAFWVDMLAGQPFNFCISAQPRQRRMVLMKTLFRLSAMQSLTIHLVHYPKLFTRYLERNQWDVASRITSLIVDIWSLEEFMLLCETLESTIPCLEELQISLSSPEGSNSYPDGAWYTATNIFDEIQALPSSSIPHLRTLYAPGIIFHLFMRRSIQHISYGLPWRPNLSYQLLRNFLHAFSKLIRLSIQRPVTSPGDDAAVRQFGKISLPFLRTLTIRSDRRNYTEPISNMFHVPALGYLHVLHIKSHGILPWVDPLLPEDLKILPSLLDGIDRVEIVNEEPYDDSFVDVAVRVCSGNIERLRISYQRYRATINSYVAFFRPYTSITYLSITVLHDDTFGRAHFFRAFPSLRTLRVVSRDAANIFRGLEGRDAADDPNSLVAPYLKTLEVSFPFRSDSDLKRALLSEARAEDVQACMRRNNCARSIRNTLRHRAERDSRLETFKWSEFEYDIDGRFEGIPTVVLPWEGDPTGPDDREMAEMRELVDSAVWFGTFTFWPFLIPEDANVAACKK